MKVLTTSFIVILAIVQATAQDSKFPLGLYRSVDDILSRSPDTTVDLDVVRRTTGEIKMAGGNDYKLVSPDGSVRKKDIKKNLVGYSDGDSLYLNCYPFRVQFWHTPILSDGKVIVVRAGLAMDPSIQKEQLNNKEQLGYLFGPIGGGIQGAKLAMLRFLYILDLRTMTAKTVTAESLTKLIADNHSLAQEFAAEEHQNDQTVLLSYLRRYNATM